MNSRVLGTYLINLFASLLLMVPQAFAENLLQPGANNEIFFNNFENVFDEAGNFVPPGTRPLMEGDHIIGIVNVQNIDVNGETLWFADFDDQLTGVLAQRVEQILDPDPFGFPSEPHVVLGPPTRTHFCNEADCFDTRLNGNEMLALYRDSGASATVFTTGGPLSLDVARAIDGEKWLTLGPDPGDSGDVGYFYAHTDGVFPPPDKAFAGLNAVVNNTGFPFFGINDVNEAEVSGSILDPPIIFTDVVLTSELETNPNATSQGGRSPWQVRSNDPATVRPFEIVAGACRFTGGGVDTVVVQEGSTAFEVEVWNGNFELGEFANSLGIDRYQFGGQAGANTGSQPQPKGEWTHHQQTGPSGSFTFHGGTSSAPEGTEIDEIRCSDEGFCFPARPAPTKQLDFDGIGTFKNIGKGKKKPAWRIDPPLLNVTAEGHGNKSFDGTFHWFEVNIDDLGEPGNENSGQNLDPSLFPELCPPEGFGEKGATALANCDCPDFYRITVYNGVDAADVVWTDGSIDPSSLDRTNVIYEVRGYINGGNLQIHPPTGFDLK